MPMYYPVVSQCIHTLKLVETWLDKAEQLAASKKLDVDVLMAARLAPDMKDFLYQVQSACSYVRAAAAWWSGQTPREHPDSEQTIGDRRQPIRKTLSSRASV